MSGACALDAVVVGAGPNGLAAAIRLARAGKRVRVLEANDTIGGGCRTAELTLPGFRHDVCSAFHPLAIASPFLRALELARHGLVLAHPDAPLAHPLDGGTAAVLERSLEATGRSLGRDGPTWSRLFAPFVRESERLVADVLAPFHVPRAPLLMARFGLLALRSASALIRAHFREPHARALFAGISAHALLRLDQPPSAGPGLLLGTLGHAVGWPVAVGGSQRLADALAACLREAGGEIETSARVGSLDDLPEARAYLLGVTPKQLLAIAGARLPAGYRSALARYRYGPGVFKLDLALAGPIPWAAGACARAGTVHVGGTFEEIAASEAAVHRGEHPERPFVLVGQQSLFDASRAPAGQHTAWAYCHVPHASTVDMTGRVLDQIERFAPGLRGRILGAHAMTTADLERHDANLVGGDIAGGVQDLWQLFTRPVARVVPYETPLRELYLCSSATPPGGGVHGMSGYYAAGAALRRSF